MLAQNNSCFGEIDRMSTIPWPKDSLEFDKRSSISYLTPQPSYLIIAAMSTKSRACGFDKRTKAGFNEKPPNTGRGKIFLGFSNHPILSQEF